jgi:hypothetical protein
MRKQNPKVMITQNYNCEEPDKHYHNANPDCVYYANHKLMVIPGNGFAYEDEYENYERIVVKVAELVECLPGVYTRTLDSEVEFADIHQDADRCGLCEQNSALYDKRPYAKFCGVAFYLNSLNNFVKTCRIGESRTYSRFSPMAASQEDITTNPRRPSTNDTTWDAFGREINVTYFWGDHDSSDFEDLDAVKFEFADNEKEVAK